MQLRGRKEASRGSPPADTSVRTRRPEVGQVSPGRQAVSLADFRVCERSREKVRPAGRDRGARRTFQWRTRDCGTPDPFQSLLSPSGVPRSRRPGRPRFEREIGIETGLRFIPRYRGTRHPELDPHMMGVGVQVVIVVACRRSLVSERFLPDTHRRIGPNLHSTPAGQTVRPATGGNSGRSGECDHFGFHGPKSPGDT